MNMINYLRIGESIAHYINVCKYKEVDVPWFVPQDAIDITKPQGTRYFETFAGHLVGSGEQSLLHICNDLIPNQRYVCATPCFRDEKSPDPLHLQYFFKVELMHVLPVDAKLALESMLKEAFGYFKKYTKPQIVTTNEGFDIMINGIEVGSYGIREHQNFRWVYGTGLAEPRFTQALGCNL